MKVVVLADTHLRGKGIEALPRPAQRHLRRADVILHAGDLVEPPLLAGLSELAPVHAVLGNNDVGLDLPETVELELGGVRIAMVHDSGPSKGREARMRRRFPEAGVVVFGHSHIPWNAPGVEGQLLFNPGSATQRRRQPHRTLGILQLAGGRIRSARVVAVDPG